MKAGLYGVACELLCRPYGEKKGPWWILNDVNSYLNTGRHGWGDEKYVAVFKARSCRLSHSEYTWRYLLC